ncbi:MAG: hypothetical protein HWD62_02540 [Cyclobacteriaceae bacterium]|nr:MAG: hypothetical protein HWD62_02540 [Cyclobacteriaceae bacterium]
MEKVMFLLCDLKGFNNIKKQRIRTTNAHRFVANQYLGTKGSANKIIGNISGRIDTIIDYQKLQTLMLVIVLLDTSGEKYWCSLQLDILHHNDLSIKTIVEKIKIGLHK